MFNFNSEETNHQNPEWESEVYEILSLSAPRQGLPDISQEDIEKLEEAYNRYEHFIGIIEGEFDEEEIEKDRQKYPHLLLPDINGSIAFGEEQCVEYMHLTTGISLVQCVVFEYEKTVDLAALGIMAGSPSKNIAEAYNLALKLIEKYQEN